jgi:hypothetical protein
MTQSIVDQTDRGQDRRATRYGARHVLWELSHDQRRRECGRLPCSADGVKIKVSVQADGSRHAGWCGVSTCGSVWACPVCSAKIANKRQEELLAAINEWTRRGGRIVFATLTMRHYKKDSLTRLWDALAGARTRMMSGRAWQVEQATWGQVMPRIVKTGKRAGELVSEYRIPTVGVVEVTHGVNGWHVHLHMVMFMGPVVDSDGVALLGAQMFNRWRDSLGASGFALPSYRRGKDFKLIEVGHAAALADYFAKGVYDGEAPAFAVAAAEKLKTTKRGVSLEVTRGDMKDSAHGNRTPFGILRGLVDVATSGDLGGRTAESVEDDENIWHDWERGSSGRRQMTWSPGLREYLGRALPDELTDEEAASLVEGTADEMVPIDGAVHRLIVATRWDGLLLNAFERSAFEGWSALAVFTGAADRMTCDGQSFREALAVVRVRLRSQWL